MIIVLLLLCLSNLEPMKVKIPPTLQVQPNDHIIARPKMTVLISCSADGMPKPRITWLKNGKQFNTGSQNGRMNIQNEGGELFISDPTPTDEGYYQCIAENLLGKAISRNTRLKFAALGSFSNTSKIVSVDLGGVAIVECGAPESIPDANIYWTHVTNQDGSGTETMIGHTSRETTDYNGRLYIFPIERTHVDNRFYICNAYNQVLGLVRKSPPIRFQITSTRSLQHEPYILWSSDKNKVYGSGDTIRIKCIFAGHPTPKTIWKRQGEKELPMARFMFNNEGQELVISNAQPIDSGVYDCYGFNDYGVQSSSIVVKVQRSLNWRSKPMDTNAVPNTSVSFICEPDLYENDSYNVEWFRNGEPIINHLTNQSMRTWSIERGRLNIEKTVVEDSCVLQCNITTNYGFLYTNAYLNIISQAPKLELNFKQYEAVEGSSIRLKCDYFAAPAPTVDWKFRRKRLKGKRYTFRPTEGSLEIQSLTFSDSGTYTCEIRNFLGSTSSQRALIVRKRTTMVTKPMNQDAKRGSFITFRCTADHDIKLIPIYEWYKDGLKIESSGRFVIDKFDQNSLKILSVQHADTGYYSCSVKTRLDNVTGGATLLVQDVPDAPAITNVVCQQSTAHISWQSKTENYAPTLFYKVQFNTTFASNVWTDFRIRQLRESVKEARIRANNQRVLVPFQEEYETSHIPASQADIVVNLTCWANTSFRVIAFNRHGSSQPSGSSEVTCSTLPCAPQKHPTNVRSIGHIPGGIRILWKPIEKLYWNSPQFWYELEWRKCDSIQKRFNTVRINSHVHSFEINGSNAYEKYEFRIRSVNDYSRTVQGVGIEADLHVGYSGEGRPRYIPSDFKLDEILDGTTARFSWKYANDRLDGKRILGRLKGFVISHYQDRCGESCRVNHTVLGNVSSAVVDSFVPWADTSAQLFVINDVYNGSLSAKLRFKMPEGCPGTVMNLKVMPFGSNGLKALWKPPTDLHGNILGYFIRVRSIKGPHSINNYIQPSEDITDANVHCYVAGGLMAQNVYRIEVKAFTSQGRSEHPAIGVLTIGQSKAPSKPIPIIGDITETSMNVSWNPFEMANPGSIFYVKYRKQSDRSGVYEYSRGETMLNFIMIYDLEIETVYDIILVAADGISNGTSSDSILKSTIGTKFTSNEISRSSWFIGVVVTIGILLLLLVVVCILIRERGINYSMREFEPGDESDDDVGFIEYIKTSAGSMLKRSNLPSRIVQLRNNKGYETEEDSFADSSNTNLQDPFGDNGSFVGQYGFPTVGWSFDNSTIKNNNQTRHFNNHK